jgi:rod shape-determining protein MreB and related proteins
MLNFQLIRRKSFGIDLGNTNTLVSDAEKILLSAPSYIVLHKTHRVVEAVGTDAYNRFEKTDDQFKPVRLLKRGVIADQMSDSQMLSRLMRKACGTQHFFEGYKSVLFS